MKKLCLATRFCVALTFATGLGSSGHAQISDDVVKIGVMADMNGPLSTASGRGSLEAARMAAEEFGWSINGKHIEIISADHQNKPDIGAAIARHWFDVEHVDVIADLTNSAVGFAVVEVARPSTRSFWFLDRGRQILQARPVRQTASSGRGTPMRPRLGAPGRLSVPTLTPGFSLLRILLSATRLSATPPPRWKN